MRRATAEIVAEKTATADIKLKKTRNLASQLTNAEWMMSIPGTEEQKAMLLDCTGCHTLERVVRSTHDADEWTHVVRRMKGYAFVSMPIKPQRMLDEAARRQAGRLPQDRRIPGDHQSERGRQMGISAQDAPASLRTSDARDRD